MAEKKASTEEATPVQQNKFDFTSLNTLAVVSLATALTSVGAVAAVITGHIALAQIKRQPKNGRALALAGLIVGYATILFWIIGAIAFTALKFKYGFGGEPMIGYGYGPMGFDDDHGMMGGR